MLGYVSSGYCVHTHLDLCDSRKMIKALHLQLLLSNIVCVRVYLLQCNARQ